jgi:hypothetical protein
VFWLESWSNVWISNAVVATSSNARNFHCGEHPGLVGYRTYFLLVGAAVLAPHSYAQSLQSAVLQSIQLVGVGLICQPSCLPVSNCVNSFCTALLASTQLKLNASMSKHQREVWFRELAQVQSADVLGRHVHLSCD